MSCAGVLLLTWHLRTRHLDFLTPRNTVLPPEDFGDDLAAGPTSLQPPIPEPSVTTQILPPPSPEEVLPPSIPEITDADLGDLSASPGLDAYRDLALSTNAARMFLLSSTLRLRGEFQRSLFGLERIIDSIEASPQELIEAGRGIQALRADLPPWNVDSMTQIPLILNLNLPFPAKEPIKKAAQSLSELIHECSSGQLYIKPKIQSASTNSPLENPPIALWFCSSKDPEKLSTVITTSLTGEGARLTDDLARAVFQAIRNDLKKLGFPPAQELNLSGQELLTEQITRLMWGEFGASLHPEEISPELSPSDLDTDEEF